jgi:hypothetical protein
MDRSRGKSRRTLRRWMDRLRGRSKEGSTPPSSARRRRAPDAEVLRDLPGAALGDVREVALFHVRQRPRVEPRRGRGSLRGRDRAVVVVVVVIGQLRADERVVVLRVALTERVLLRGGHRSRRTTATGGGVGAPFARARLCGGVAWAGKRRSRVSLALSLVSVGSMKKQTESSKRVVARRPRTPSPRAVPAADGVAGDRDASSRWRAIRSRRRGDARTTS